MQEEHSKPSWSAWAASAILGIVACGPFFLFEDLPADPEVRGRVLLAAMGSPDPRRIDGLGGATRVTSKVAMVSLSERPGLDVDYRFAQVWLD